MRQTKTMTKEKTLEPDATSTKKKVDEKRMEVVEEIKVVELLPKDCVKTIRVGNGHLRIGYLGYERDRSRCHCP